MKMTRTVELTFEKSERVVTHRRRIVSVSRDRRGDEMEAERPISQPKLRRTPNVQKKLVDRSSEEP